MSFSKEFTQVVSVDAGDFTSLLRQSVDRKIAQGRNGIGRLVATKDSVKLDEGEVRYRDFYMSEAVFQLGTKLKGVVPAHWAAAMMNVELSERKDAVDLYFATGFRKQYAEQLFSGAIANYFKKPVKFNVSSSVSLGV